MKNIRTYVCVTMASPWQHCLSPTRTSLIDTGLTSMTVQRRVSTNWEMCRSLSLISTGSSAMTAL